MNTSRRNFLVKASIAGPGLLATSLINAQSPTSASDAGAQPQLPGVPPARRHIFNMCGFAAPAIPTVRIGIIGVGNRGGSAVQRLRNVPSAKIVGIAEIRAEKIAEAQKLLKGTHHAPVIHTGDELAWKKMCTRDDLDLIYICTPWNMHAPMAVFAMNHGKHVATEVPAAITVDECWDLVETSERTQRHCMMLENTCYDYFEMLTFRLARNGFFGDIIHCEGAYLHDLLEKNFLKTSYSDMWRLKQNMRNGNLYPTHGLGPIAQIMNINRGERMDYLVSVQSADFGMKKLAQEHAAKDPFYRQYASKSFRGSINTTTIKTVGGRTIMLQHDISTPRPYSRIHCISGTKATCLKYPLPPRLSIGHEWATEDEFKKIEEANKPTLWSNTLGELAKKVGGHGGMDFIMDYRLVEALHMGMPLDQDVYDAATWSVIGPLSEISVANRARSLDVPDFTNGRWRTNKPLEYVARS